MESYFTCAFALRKSRKKSNSQSDLFARVNVNGKVATMSLNRKIDPVDWNKAAERMKGKTPAAYEMNLYLDMIRTKFNKVHRRLKDDEKYITASLMVEEFNSDGKSKKMVLEVFKEHNKDCDQRSGKDISKSTVKRYYTCYNHVAKFIKEYYKQDDYRFRDVDHQFLTKFEHFLKTTQACNHNSSLKYINNFKKIVRIAIANKWLESDPFYNFKVRYEEVIREYLTADEIKTLWETEFHFDRFTLVRDMFVFSCYTGLAYSDVEKLSKEDVTVGIDGDKWIRIYRTKTNSRSSLPLLPIAEQIINRYTDHPQVVHTNRLIPVFTNQKSNAFLKEIAVICGITKPLNTHLARHTFATTVTLSNGVPLESVSKMLGHKSLRTTQHYAKIVDRKISDDMKVLRVKLEEVDAKLEARKKKEKDTN